MIKNHAALMTILMASLAMTVMAADLPEADRATLEEYLGKEAVGKAVEAGPVGKAGSYLPSSATQWVYVLTAGEKSGQSMEVSVQVAPDQWTAVAKDDFQKHWQLADGTLRLMRDEQAAHHVFTHYAPGELVLVEGMKPGEQRSETIQVQVFKQADDKQPQYTGSLEQTFTYVGACELHTAAGTFEAIILRSDFKGKVGPAEIEDTSYRLLAPGAGVVASVDRRQVHAMLIYSEDTRRARLLKSHASE